jgi:hypothetical protein
MCSAQIFHRFQFDNDHAFNDEIKAVQPNLAALVENRDILFRLDA